MESLRLAPVVVAPEKIICVGLNYRRHAVEANMPIPTTPVIFGKFANSLSASRDRIALPAVDFKYDYEAELGVIIGREALDVAVDQALASAAGHCDPHDLSARDAHPSRCSFLTTDRVTYHVFPNLDPENAVLEGIVTLREAASVKDAELLELARDADAGLSCSRPLSPDIVEAMKNCRIIARYGIG